LHGTKEGLVGIIKNRKSRAGTPTIESKSRSMLRRPADSVVVHHRPFRVRATKLARRRFLHLAAGVAAIPAISRSASAQTYPARPVHLIVGFTAGAPSDIAARLIGQWLFDRLGQPFVVENRAGAGGNLATGAVVKAPPDGYTLLLAGSNDAINATLYENLSFSFILDIAPVAAIIQVPNVMVVNPSLPAKTVPEFIAYAKANLGKVNFASAGIGTVQHVAGELFKVMTGVDMRHVPYRGSPQALTDLLSGQVQVLFSPMPACIEFIRVGKLRALAVTTASRSDVLPGTPTVGEFLPGFEASIWNGLGAPKSTPAEIIDKLNKEINAALADPKMRARLADLGATVLPGSPAEFGTFMANETEKWGKVVKFAGLKPE
jgi:tripartite-type tricarboxylate transporter receptor subunit TctC